MLIFMIVLGGAVLALAFAGAGVSKLAGVPIFRDAAQRFGIPLSAYRALGALEIAGAAGIIVGLSRIGSGDAGLGVVAASCLFLLIVGAVAMQVRAADHPAQWTKSATSR